MSNSEMEKHGSEDAAGARPLWFGVIGGVLGGVVGYFGFFAALEHASLYAMVMPGAFIGLGRAIGSPTKSIPMGVVCGVAAVVLSLVIEWQITPLNDDATIADFFAGLPNKPFRNLASLVAGPLMALWFGVGRGVPNEKENAPPQ